jgi:hypothetical protein
MKTAQWPFVSLVFQLFLNYSPSLKKQWGQPLNPQLQPLLFSHTIPSKKQTDCLFGNNLGVSMAISSLSSRGSQSANEVELKFFFLF